LEAAFEDLTGSVENPPQNPSACLDFVVENAKFSQNPGKIHYSARIL
jgi:hypothetical protein